MKTQARAHRKLKSFFFLSEIVNINDCEREFSQKKNC